MMVADTIVEFFPWPHDVYILLEGQAMLFVSNHYSDNTLEQITTELKTDDRFTRFAYFLTTRIYDTIRHGAIYPHTRLAGGIMMCYPQFIKDAYDNFNDLEGW
jgi:hypothetical protein